MLVIAVSGAIFLGLDMAVGIWTFILGWLALRRDQGNGAHAIAWLGARPMQALGRISYSLYLLHMVPLYVGMSLLGDAGLERKPLPRRPRGHHVCAGPADGMALHGVMSRLPAQAWRWRSRDAVAA